MTDLLLRYQTPPSWAAVALSDSVALLSDHAHLEKKAAANALELINRFPATLRPAQSDLWVHMLAVIAREETEHLAQATRLLARAGATLPRHHKNPYASALRLAVRSGQGDLELLDRLLVSALIEARSCERFELLAEQPAPTSPPAFDALPRFYRGLTASEQGHYLVFVEMAQMIAPEHASERWSQLLDHEATAMKAQSPGPRMHSGV